MLNLAGIWALLSVDDFHHVDMPIPGDAHSALIAAGVIPDPYVGKNELDVRWVADKDWIASRTFHLESVPESYLDITYLDTVATISINGVEVLSARNCFRRFRPDVTKALRVGENTIEILFHSNTKAANELQAKQPFYIPYSTNNCPIPDGNMLRKPACHFGWDWNLAVTPFGLYGEIALRHKKSAAIGEVQVDQRIRPDGSIEVSIVVSKATGNDLSASFNGEQRQISNGPLTFVVRNPRLWWPAGQGEQHLYDLTIQCGDQIETRKIGLRKIELVTSPDEAGSRFVFKVNGEEIFCRGANWIPADALPSRATLELTRKLLKAAVDANMNMIRVWGGGFYEQDFFYDICDELGILVWQDFMFACNLYPSTDEFIEEVEEEVRYQVERLQHHACIALWCGDNELIGALLWFKESRENRDRYLVNYDRLNRAIEMAAKQADDTINWWPSSPSPGVLNFGDAWHDDSSGDMHFWSVWHESKDFEHYRDVRPRFCSEFGFQSFPSMDICKQFADAKDLNISSPVMEWHQKNTGGNARIAETMFRYFRFPMDFADFVYLSQVQHGLAMRVAVEGWRSLKPHCMGALYWQLNDTWPVASWSGLDHGGGWKSLHYMARRFFAPVAVFAVPSKDGKTISMMAVNDTRKTAVVELECFAVSPSGDVIKLNSTKAEVPTDRAVEVVTILSDAVPDTHILHFKSFVGGKSTSNHFAPKPYKTYDLQDPEIKLSVKGDSLTLSTTKPAYYVSVEANMPGHFSDNAFDLLPGESKIISFTADDKLSSPTFTTRSLYSATCI